MEDFMVKMDEEEETVMMATVKGWVRAYSKLVKDLTKLKRESSKALDLKISPRWDDSLQICSALWLIWLLFKKSRLLIYGALASNLQPGGAVHPLHHFSTRSIRLVEAIMSLFPLSRNDKSIFLRATIDRCGDVYAGICDRYCNSGLLGMDCMDIVGFGVRWWWWVWHIWLFWLKKPGIRWGILNNDYSYKFKLKCQSLWIFFYI